MINSIEHDNTELHNRLSVARARRRGEISSKAEFELKGTLPALDVDGTKASVRTKRVRNDERRL